MVKAILITIMILSYVGLLSSIKKYLLEQHTAKEEKEYFI